MVTHVKNQKYCKLKIKKKLYLNLIEQHILHAADEIHVGKYK